jgi:glycosyltransferase involved in cell wall biosynthesis
MKILLTHNFYQQPGGEDTAFQRELELLRSKGHEVLTYERSNSETDELSLLGKAGLPANMIWSSRTFQEVKTLLEREKPDLAHFHNTHFMISPSAYYACRESDVPVIQSLDNPRLMCPSANFFRDGHPCEDCLHKTPPWPSILHACYRGSRLQTGAVALMLTTHRLLGTWQKLVDRYLVATETYKKKFVEGGLPAEKITVKPHFVSPDPGRRQSTTGEYALFIGRLDPEKGVPTLLNAWEKINHIPIKIRGSGKLFEQVKTISLKNPQIQIVDRLSQTDLTQLIKGARFLVWPSEGCYETFGFVAAEAYACGVPVIASNIGVMQEMVHDGVTGLHFIQGSADDLVAKVSWAWGHPDEIVKMGTNARQEFEKKYTADRVYPQMLEVYQTVISQRSLPNA